MDYEYVLETNNLCKSYNGVQVVKDVNMHIKQGDIYGFIGENGAGKTTIMRMISGLTYPTSGSYKIFGVSEKDKNIYNVKREMGGIVELVSLTKNMTALDNLKMQAIIVNVKKSNEELIELIQKVGLVYEEIKNKKVGNFSLGMKQRLGIAMTLISNPKFILLDEPMNGLDPQGFVEMRETILNLNKEGVTFLISSHILSELEKIVNHVGFISHGRLLEEISMDDLHKKARKRISITPVDLNKTLEILKTLNIKDMNVENNVIEIFDELNINDLIKTFVNNNCDIDKISMIEDTIEDYYIKLLRG